MSDVATTYAQAAAVPGLALDRAARLVEHVISRDRALGQDRTPASVVRLAAVLLAAQPHGLSSPTALAEAETVAATPGLGVALLDAQKGLSALADFTFSGDEPFMHDGLQRGAICRVLRHLIAEATGLLNRLEVDDRVLK